MPHQKKKWVIVFLIYADFRKDKEDSQIGPFAMNEEMKIELNLMFKEILTTPLNPEYSRLFVILNGIKYIILDGQQLKIENKTLLYEIVNPNYKTYNQFGDFQIIDSSITGSDQPLPTSPLQVPNKLSSFLEKIKVDEDEEVFLITWDHGSAFGIFRERTPIPSPVVIRKPILDELERFPYLKEFWEEALRVKSFNDFISEEKLKISNSVIQSGHSLYKISDKEENKNFFLELLGNEHFNKFLEIDVGSSETAKLIFNTEKFDRTKAFEGNQFMNEEIVKKTLTGVLLEERVTEILKNDELAKGIKDWLTDKKVGVLLMMNCWMMNLHTMYSLRECVQCLVAPQGDISIPGYNYRDILKYVYKPENLFNSPQKLARKCVQTCENKFAFKRQKKVLRLTKKHASIDSWKIIAIDLQVKDANSQCLFDQQIDALRRLIQTINFRLSLSTSTQSEVKWLFKYVRSVCFDFSNRKSKMIDIVNWCLSILSADEGFAGVSSKIFGDIQHNIVEFRNSIIKNQGDVTLILKMSKGKSVYSVDIDPLSPKACINLPPTGYSLFFPECDFNRDPNLLDNVKSDIFLNEFLFDWKTFLNTSIDKNITF